MNSDKNLENLRENLHTIIEQSKQNRIENLLYLCYSILEKLKGMDIPILSVLPDFSWTDRYNSFEDYLDKTFSPSTRKEVERIEKVLNDNVIREPYILGGVPNNDVDDLSRLSKEELIELILRERIFSRKICENCNRPKVGMDNEIIDDGSAYNNQVELSSDNLTHAVYRRRNGKQLPPFQSKIDLREDDNRTSESDDDKDIHSIINYVRVIYVLKELGFFTQFDPSINPKENGDSDIKRQKDANLNDIFDIFGRAVNIEGLGSTYNNHFAKQWSRDSKNGKEPYSVIDIMDIFIRLYDKMRDICDVHILKKESLIDAIDKAVNDYFEGRKDRLKEIQAEKSKPRGDKKCQIKRDDCL